MRSSTMRAMTSLALPEENGMMAVIGLTGYSWAFAPPLKKTRKKERKYPATLII
jgi:hypothetical protein